jgi:hypothetical protein
MEAQRKAVCQVEDHPSGQAVIRVLSGSSGPDATHLEELAGVDE